MAEYTLTPTQSARLDVRDDGDDGDDEPETCTVELDRGGVCGRDTPCPYHD